LPPDQRAVLLLVSVEGMSYQDIAATLDVPIGTVMSRLSRARKAFRSIIDNEVPQPVLRIAT
jgi:RNA polymerase sigma-70 factor (ECF subfamily)